MMKIFGVLRRRGMVEAGLEHVMAESEGLCNRAKDH
jgi:hypothetical protein